MAVPDCRILLKPPHHSRLDWQPAPQVGKTPLVASQLDTHKRIRCGAKRLTEKGKVMDTIILLVLLVTAIAAAKGAKAKVVVPLFLVAYVMVVLLFAHHTTSSLDLNF